MNTLLVVWLTACSADAATSYVAIQSYGAREAVLPVKSPTGIVLVAATQAVVGWWAYKKLLPHHPKMAKILFSTSVATHSAAAVWNASLMRP